MKLLSCLPLYVLLAVLSLAAGCSQPRDSDGAQSIGGASEKLPTISIRTSSTTSKAALIPLAKANGVAFVVEGDSGSSIAVFTIVLDQVSSSVVSVDFATVAGTASAGLDFKPFAKRISLLPGETTATISLQVIPDLIFETDEEFSVVLSNPTNATLGDSDARAVILNDDAPPQVSVNAPAIVEGNSGTKSLVFRVSINAGSEVSSSVRFSTSDGTATAGIDYQSVDKQLNFTPGVLFRTVQVPIVGDTIDEADESIIGSLTNLTNLTASSAMQSEGLIEDDDPVAPNIFVSADGSDATVAWQASRPSDSYELYFGPNPGITAGNFVAKGATKVVSPTVGPVSIFKFPRTGAYYFSSRTLRHGSYSLQSPEQSAHIVVPPISFITASGGMGRASHNGRFIFVNGDSILDTDTGAMIATAPNPGPFTFRHAISDDGRWVVGLISRLASCPSGTRTFALVDRQNGDATSLILSCGPAATARMSADGTKILIGSLLYDRNSNTVSPITQFPSNVNESHISGDGSMFVARSGTQWTLVKAGVVSTLQYPSGSKFAGFGGDAFSIVSGGKIRITQSISNAFLAENTTIFSDPLMTSIQDADLSSNGRYLAYAGDVPSVGRAILDLVTQKTRRLRNSCTGDFQIDTSLGGLIARPDGTVLFGSNYPQLLDCSSVATHGIYRWDSPF